MEKFKGKYRSASHRNPVWDYAGSGCYFITICTQNMKCWLGEITDHSMKDSDFGKIVREEWWKSFQIREELYCPQFVMMPNHIHAIVILKNDRGTNIPPKFSKWPRRPKSISSFVAGYKSTVTTQIDDFIDANDLPMPKFNRDNRFWQRNYHDRILRDQNEFHRISNYIRNNPKNWDEDQFNPINHE